MPHGCAFDRVDADGGDGSVGKIAGPGVIAAIMVLTGHPAANRAGLLGAVMAAWAATTLILLSALFLARVLRRRGLMAVERLMGMLLIVVAVPMFLDGLHLPSRVLRRWSGRSWKSARRGIFCPAKKVLPGYPPCLSRIKATGLREK